MIVSDCRTQAKETLAEKGAYWSDAEILRAMNRANRDVWRLIQGVDPTQLAGAPTHFTYPAATASIDITGASYLNAAFRTILAISKLDATGAFSETNRPIPLELGTYADLLERYRGSRQRSGQLTESQYFAAIHGNLLYLAPVPQAAVILEVDWVGFPAELTADAHNLLQATTAGAPLGTAYHDYIMLRTAWYMSAKEKRGGLAPEVTQCMENLRVELADNEQNRTHLPRIVYASPY